MPFCPKCHFEVSATASFCTTCGADLHNVVRDEVVPDDNLLRDAASNAAVSNDHVPPAVDTEAVSPAPAPMPAIRIPTMTGTIPENVLGMLAYFGIPAVFFLLIEPFKRNRFVRFHSLQGLMTLGVLLAIHIVLGIFLKFVPLIVLPLYGLLLIAEITLLLLLLFKAYRGEEFKLPYVGAIAEERAAVS